MSGYNIAGCAVCSVGCDPVNAIPNGTCPKFWERPEGSSLCSQSWTCSQFSNPSNRIVGGVFLLVALLYVRIMYYNYKKGSPDTVVSTLHTTTSQHDSLLGLGVFKRALRAWKRFSPRTHAR